MDDNFLNEKPQLEKSIKPHYAGHRQRLKNRFLEKGANSLADYELLELLLFYAIPQRDVKPLSKQLIAEYESFAALFSESSENLTKTNGIKENTAILFKLIEALNIKMSQEKLKDKPLLATWQAMQDYCRLKMAHLIHEEFHLLFLDYKGHLLKDELQQKGTINQTAIYPREVVKRCLELGASACIMVHNHPSGDPSPSKADIDMTMLVKQATKAVGIQLIDHLIVGKNTILGFKQLGLL